MVQLYYILVTEGRRDIENVPERYRAEVQSILTKPFYGRGVTDGCNQHNRGDDINMWNYRSSNYRSTPT